MVFAHRPRGTDVEPRTHLEVRLVQQRHYSYIRRGLPKSLLDASQKATGLKGSCAFSRLEYFNVVRDYLLDGMHIFSNVIARHHSALLGAGWSQDVRNCARALDINARNLCRRPPPPAGPSPWALSKDGLQKARRWVRRDLRLPRSWGTLRRDVLKPTTANPKKACKLKAAAAITACTSGLLATVGAWNGEDDWTDNPCALQYAAFLGKFAVCTRELTGAQIILEVSREL